MITIRSFGRVAGIGLVAAGIMGSLLAPSVEAAEFKTEGVVGGGGDVDELAVLDLLGRSAARRFGISAREDGLVVVLGSRSGNAAPPPAALAAPTVPPCSAATPATMERPSPAPVPTRAGSACQNRSNAWTSPPSSSPGPWSRTVRVASPATNRADISPSRPECA
jgi:hypothetical protein